MEKIVLGFLDGPSFLAVSPMIEVSQEDSHGQEIVPVASLHLENTDDTFDHIVYTEKSSK